EKTTDYILDDGTDERKRVRRNKVGGLGKGELQGPYIEEEFDPMPDNEEEYRESFQYKQGETKGTSGSNVNVETNDEPRETSKLREAIDIPAKEYDSPAHAMGPATQKESLTLSLLQLSVFKEGVDPVEKAVMYVQEQTNFANWETAVTIFQAALGVHRALNDIFEP
nr:hypothetical protein [Tanacetum cinerariifolium]